MSSLRSRILRHDNDYGFHPRRIPKGGAEAPCVACVVPWYETGDIGFVCVHTVAESLRSYAEATGARTRLVVVDDGSVDRPFVPNDPYDAETVVSERNAGRAAARNTGLAATDEDIVLFIDSDVAVPPGLVSEVARLSVATQATVGEFAVIPSFFLTAVDVRPESLPVLVQVARPAHDWRWHCTYQPSWVGCAADQEYVGRTYRLVEQTDQFRSWQGGVGPWVLPNMVLGGCFAVPGDEARTIGFDEHFSTYGFTETTLVARLIADVGTKVVPQLRFGAVHAEANPAHLSQQRRNAAFRRAHRRFFTGYCGSLDDPVI